MGATSSETGKATITATPNEGSQRPMNALSMPVLSQVITNDIIKAIIKAIRAEKSSLALVALRIRD